MSKREQLEDMANSLCNREIYRVRYKRGNGYFLDRVGSDWAQRGVWQPVCHFQTFSIGERWLKDKLAGKFPSFAQLRQR